MDTLRPTVYYTGRGNSCVVSVQDETPQGLVKLKSPSDITGAGGCYGVALEDYIEQFDKYLRDLKKFRAAVLDTKRAYFDAVEVDSAGRPVK